MKESSITEIKANLQKEIDRVLMPRLRQMAIELVVDAVRSKEHGDLTGNTITSYSAGIYNNRQLVDVVRVIDILGMEQPTRNKLTYDSIKIYVLNRYDNGQKVAISGASLVKTDEGYGFDTAETFLRSLKVGFKSWCIVVTTGTEYSNYIETSRNLNVLTETFLDAGSIIGHLLK